MRRSRVFAPFGGILLMLAAVAGSIVEGRGQTQVNVPETLQTAFDNYRNANSRAVEAACDRVIASLVAIASPDDIQIRQLLTAYELRARARFVLRNQAGARDDFRLLLTRAPEHEYGSLTAAATVPVNPDSATLFDAVRKEIVGAVILMVSPDDAEVRLNDMVVSRDRRMGGRAISVLAGRVRVSARKAGHQTRDEEVAVQPGTPTTVTLDLERLSSTIEIVTVPAGVEVFVDNVSKGKTPAIPLPARYASHQDVLAMQGGGETSGVLEILDVPSGTRQIEFRLDCYRTESSPLVIDKAGDFFVPKKLSRSSGQLSVEGAGGVVYIDGVRKGPVPYTQELCPQPEPYLVEVRSDRGRQISRVRPVSGQTIPIRVEIRPAIAVLSQVGLPDGFRDDLRRELEAVLKPEGMTFIAVSGDEAKRELDRNRLSPGWLSFSPSGVAMSDTARAIRPATRLEVSTSLSRSLEVQGVAEINATAGARDPRSLLLTFLAAGSGVPETIAVRLDEPGSVRSALATLNQKYPIAGISSAIQVADVEGAGGAVVLRQVWDLTGGVRLTDGDLIVSADGRKIEDGTAFDALVATKKPGDQVSLQVKGKDGAVKTAVLKPENFARVVSYFDETLPINKLLLDFRLAVQDARSPVEQGVARLNLAVVLMRAGNWSDAKAELDRIELKDLAGGQGISRGTVQYYLGLCLDALGRPAEADKAFQAASNSPGALLTADGPLVKPLADEKLSDKTRRQR